ncbi:MAG: choline dehydrogenase, partial [Candidatus Binatia bacterium]
QSAIDYGFKGPVDLNGAQQETAIGYCQSTTTPDLARASTAIAYLDPIMGQPNFTQKTNTQATRVLFEGNQAVGVEYVEDGSVRQARASSEVI